MTMDKETENRLTTLEVRMEILEQDMQELKKDMKEVIRMLSEAKGGWRLLMLGAGVSAFLTTVIFKMIETLGMHK